jgi:hypothetical protein
MENTIILTILLIFVSIVCIMLLIQIYRLGNIIKQYKKKNLNKRALRHDLINYIGPLDSLCTMLKNDHNILSEKSKKMLKAMLENCSCAMKCINNIKE